MTDTIRGILWPLRGHHAEMVFTYVANRTRKTQKLIKGERYPITYSGLNWHGNALGQAPRCSTSGSTTTATTLQPSFSGKLGT